MWSARWGQASRLLSTWTVPIFSAPAQGKQGTRDVTSAPSSSGRAGDPTNGQREAGPGLTLGAGGSAGRTGHPGQGRLQEPVRAKVRMGQVSTRTALWPIGVSPEGTSGVTLGLPGEETSPTQLRGRACRLGHSPSP